MLSATLHAVLLLGLQLVGAASVAPPEPGRPAAPVMTGRVIAAPAQQAAPAVAPPEALKPVAEPKPVPVSAGASAPGDLDVQVEFAYADYLEPSRLTQRPAVLGSIDIPYPDLRGEKPAIQVVLTLYINERGIVDRVQVEDPDAPGSFIEAAKQAFSSAAFQPGRAGDQPAKAKIRIAVDFDVREGESQRLPGK
jgi:outer membrane biosynthesis protein TonB